MTSANNYIPAGPCKILSSYNQDELESMVNDYITTTKKAHDNKQAFYDIDFNTVIIPDQHHTKIKYIAFIMLSFVGEREHAGCTSCHNEEVK